MMILKRNIYLEAYSSTIFHMARYLKFNEVIASCFSDHLGSITANFNSSTTGRNIHEQIKSDKKKKKNIGWELTSIWWWKYILNWDLDFKQGKTIELGSNQFLKIFFISYRQKVRSKKVRNKLYKHDKCLHYVQ